MTHKRAGLEMPQSRHTEKGQIKDDFSSFWESMTLPHMALLSLSAEPAVGALIICNASPDFRVGPNRSILPGRAENMLFRIRAANNSEKRPQAL